MDRYNFIIEQIKAAGNLLMRLKEEKFETLSKGGDPRNVVTSVDFAVNDFLIRGIREVFPNDAIHSEESSEQKGTTTGTWAIDPIDGSSNFSRDIPHYAVCIAYLENGVPLVGAVHNPVTHEIFSFQKGKGAFLNSKTITVSTINALKDASVFLHAGRKPELWDWGGTSYTKLLRNAQKTSNYGGSALDTCFVAAGRIEANIYGRLTTMDIAAAVGVLLEAGGRVVNEMGEPISFSAEPQRVIMSNNQEIESAILKLLF